jgi:DNA modification methylase
VTAVIVRADARALPLPDGSVDLIVTSPPYYGLRDYRDGDGSLAGQIGSEATPAEYIAALVACTREWVRVLKPSGSMFINLGDKYNSAASGQNGHLAEWTVQRRTGGAHGPGWQASSRRSRAVSTHPPKTLLGLPWRYALACTDELGLILRRDVIWSKPNGLPESVTDRCRSSHEYVFHLTRRPRYYAAVDEIREPHSEASIRRAMPHRAKPGGRGRDAEVYNGQPGQTLRLDQMNNPLGALPGSVWEIPSQPLAVPAGLGIDHFAAFPMELPRRVIAGWSPPGICTACGEGRRPVLERDVSADGRRYLVHDHGSSQPARRFFNTAKDAQRTITGYACACPQPGAPTRPAIVADPFGGTGTTAIVADALGRTGLSFDRSAAYCRLARWRAADPGQRALARQVPKPPPVMDGQDTLFAL